MDDDAWTTLRVKRATAARVNGLGLKNQDRAVAELLNHYESDQRAHS